MRLDKETMNSINWWHHIDLGPELGVTPGRESSPRLRDSYLNIPKDLYGKAVLDIGAWDGLYSFVAEERGAHPVVAMDLYNATGTAAFGTLFPDKTGIEFARRARKSEVTILVGDINNCVLQADQFDVIFMLGVLYHLQNPIGALRNVRYLLKSGGLLILETAMDFLNIDRPCAAFYPGAENGKDPTNWFCPNIKCAEGWIQTAGFTNVRFQGGIGLDTTRPNETVQYGRGAFHASK